MAKTARLHRLLIIFWLAVILVNLPVAASNWNYLETGDYPGQKNNQEPKNAAKPELKRIPTTSTNDSSQDDIVIKSKEVVLDVAVFDRDNHFVGDLKKEHFQVFEDQIQQTIESCSREEAPISLGLVIDTSGSMRSKLPTVIKSALYLVRQAKKNDEFFVVDFKEKAELVEEFTSRVPDIEDALDNLIAGSGTALLDAVAVAAEYAHKEGHNRRKALVIMSDGDERDSFYKKKELINLMHEYDVQLYIVGFPDELSDDSGLFKKSPRKKATELIHDIATESGGRAFFPESLDELAEIARQINTDLRTQYTITYAPTNPNEDGTYRKIAVRADDGKRKLIVRTRAGYTAAKDDKKK